MNQAIEDRARPQLEMLTRRLRDLHRQILEAERTFHPASQGLALLDRLLNDPTWAWLRPLSELIADIDHVLAGGEVSIDDVAVAAAHTRELLKGEGTATNAAFVQRTRSLLQTDPVLVSMYGELRGTLASVPTESEIESERLHARHQWAMRCKHRIPH